MTTWPNVLAALREEQRRKPHPTPSAPERWARWYRVHDDHPRAPIDQVARARQRRASVITAVAKLGKPSRAAGSPRWRDIAHEARVGVNNVETLWKEAVRRGEV